MSNVPPAEDGDPPVGDPQEVERLPSWADPMHVRPAAPAEEPIAYVPQVQQVVAPLFSPPEQVSGSKAIPFRSPPPVATPASQPVSTPQRSPGRLGDGTSAWWNGWEWRWNPPGQLMGDVPWPFVIRPATVTWARLLCVLQGLLGMIGGLALGVVVVLASRHDRVDQHVTLLATAGGVQLGWSGLTMFFGSALRTMSRGPQFIVSTIQLIQIGATVIVVQATGTVLGYAGLFFPVMVLALLWIDPYTRHGFRMNGRTVMSPTGEIVLRVVSPRRVVGVVPEYPPGPPMHAPPPRPQRSR